MPQAPRKSTRRTQDDPSGGETRTTSDNGEDAKPDAAKPDAVMADMQRAQQDYTTMVEEAYRTAMSRSSDAYQRYLEATTAVARDLEQRAADALQAFQSSLASPEDAGDLAQQCNDAYEEYARAVAELFDTSQAGARVLEADASYLRTVSEAQGQPDGEARVAEAYATYLNNVRDAWDKSAEVERVNKTLGALLDLLRLAQAQYQKRAYESYGTYLETLRRAPAELDVVRRAEEAHNTYLTTLDDTWQSAREAFNKAAASTVLKTLQVDSSTV